MADYIEREAAIAWFMPYVHAGESIEADVVISDIKGMKAPDVEPVVRCRECKHHCWVQEPCHGNSVHYCKLPHMRGIEIFKEFFCYYGERKEGAD